RAPRRTHFPYTTLFRSYDGEGRLIQASDADGFQNHYRYDEANQLIENHYKTGLVFTFRYDRRRRCIESYGAYPGARDPSLAAGLDRKSTRLNSSHVKIS